MFTTFDGDPVALIVSSNFSRRHLNKSQRAMALARMEGLVTQLPVREAADLIGASHPLVIRARYVLNHASDLVSQVEDGASLNDAYRIAADRQRSEQEREWLLAEPSHR
jgi:hypothetical protein